MKASRFTIRDFVDAGWTYQGPASWKRASDGATLERDPEAGIWVFTRPLTAKERSRTYLFRSLRQFAEKHIELFKST